MEVVVEVEVVAGVVAAVVVRSDPPDGVGPPEAADPPADAEAGSAIRCRASASGVIVGGFGEVPNC